LNIFELETRFVRKGLGRSVLCLDEMGAKLINSFWCTGCKWVGVITDSRGKYSFEVTYTKGEDTGAMFNVHAVKAVTVSGPDDAGVTTVVLDVGVCPVTLRGRVDCDGWTGESSIAHTCGVGTLAGRFTAHRAEMLVARRAAAPAASETPAAPAKVDEPPAEASDSSDSESSDDEEPVAEPAVVAAVPTPLTVASRWSGGTWHGSRTLTWARGIIATGPPPTLWAKFSTTDQGKLGISAEYGGGIAPGIRFAGNARVVTESDIWIVESVLVHERFDDELAIVGRIDGDAFSGKVIWSDKIGSIEEGTFALTRDATGVPAATAAAPLSSANDAAPTSPATELRATDVAPAAGGADTTLRAAGTVANVCVRVLPAVEKTVVVETPAAAPEGPVAPAAEPVPPAAAEPAVAESAAPAAEPPFVAAIPAPRGVDSALVDLVRGVWYGKIDGSNGAEGTTVFAFCASGLESSGEAATHAIYMLDGALHWDSNFVSGRSYEFRGTVVGDTWTGTRRFCDQSVLESFTFRRVHISMLAPTDKIVDAPLSSEPLPTAAPASPAPAPVAATVTTEWVQSKVLGCSFKQACIWAAALRVAGLCSVDALALFPAGVIADTARVPITVVGQLQARTAGVAMTAKRSG
jgi:hypothetical protein